MPKPVHVLSIYEGFFTGGARILHTDVLTGLHGPRQQHRVLSVHGQMRREETVQRLEDDACYRRLRAAGIPVTSLGRRHTPDAAPASCTEAEAEAVRLQARDARVILSLKEQPLPLVRAAGLTAPVAVCLHRSDPRQQPQALAALHASVASGQITAAICCAESTKAAYRNAGIPAGLLTVIPNGVDLRRFRPDPDVRARARRELAIAPEVTVVVFAARYDTMKDVPLFLDAATRFLRRDPRARVLMCGAGMTGANTRLRGDIAAAFGDRVHLTDRVDLLGVRHDMAALYAAADVVALTSSHGEAAPLCLIEGMMCGAVPVTTDVGDCAALVSGHGILTPHDGAAIAAAWHEGARRRTEFTARLLAQRDRFGRGRMLRAYAQVITRAQRDAGVPARPLIGTGSAR